MRKKSFLRVLVGILIVVLIIVFSLAPVYIKAAKAYPSPEAAVKDAWLGQYVKIANVTEHEGFAFVWHYKTPEKWRREELLKDDKGWHLVSSVFGITVKVKGTTKYRFRQLNWQGQTYFVVEDPLRLDDIQIVDSENSAFTCYEYEEQFLLGDIWILRLDQIPKGYWIMINGEKIQIN